MRGRRRERCNHWNYLCNSSLLIISHLATHSGLSSSTLTANSISRLMMMITLRLTMTVVILPTTLVLVEGTTMWTRRVRLRKIRATDFVMGTKYKLKSLPHSGS